MELVLRILGLAGSGWRRAAKHPRGHAVSSPTLMANAYTAAASLRMLDAGRSFAPTSAGVRVVATRARKDVHPGLILADRTHALLFFFYLLNPATGYQEIADVMSV